METSIKPKAAPVKEKVDTVKEKVETVNESVYTAEELAANHKVFNTSREIVEVALRLAGKKSASFREAKAIIEKFKTKEVK